MANVLKKMFTMLLVTALLSMGWYSAVFADETPANTALVNIDGTDYVFYLKEADLSYGNQIEATYITFNPRGEMLYRLRIQLDKDIPTGSYTNKDRTYDNDIYLDTEYYSSTNVWGKSYRASYSRGSFDLNLSYRSDDWMTYEGSFTGSLNYTMRDNNISISCSYFNFTMGTTNELATSLAAETQKEESNSTSDTEKSSAGTAYSAASNYYDDYDFDEDTYSGKSSVDHTCRSCHGTGNCSICGGDGNNSYGSSTGREHSCHTCHGSGRCQVCYGTGKVY